MLFDGLMCYILIFFSICDVSVKFVMWCDVFVEFVKWWCVCKICEVICVRFVKSSVREIQEVICFSVRALPWSMKYIRKIAIKNFICSIYLIMHVHYTINMYHLKCVYALSECEWNLWCDLLVCEIYDMRCHFLFSLLLISILIPPISFSLMLLTLFPLIYITFI